MLSDSVQRVVRSSYLDAFQFVPRKFVVFLRVEGTNESWSVISAACSRVMLPNIMWQREETVE